MTREEVHICFLSTAYRLKRFKSIDDILDIEKLIDYMIDKKVDKMI